MEDRIKQLEAKIADLEKKLEVPRQRVSMADLSAEEIKAYQKVRDVIAADWGEFCGVNDCFRCIPIGLCGPVTRCIPIARCINECVCGPCNVAGFGGGVGGSFGGFGN